MSTIPCKRPRVEVSPFGDDLHTAQCQVPGCFWIYGAGLKTDVAEKASWHRREHRDAVPSVEVRLAGDGHRWAASCSSCIRVETKSTRTDIDAWVAYHLSAVHGLVPC